MSPKTDNLGASLESDPNSNLLRFLISLVVIPHFL